MAPKEKQRRFPNYKVPDDWPEDWPIPECSSLDVPHYSEVEDPQVYWTEPVAEEKSETLPEHQRWKRDVLSPKGKADSPLPPSEPASSHEDPACSESTSTAAKRMKKREEERKSNDLMTCLTIREGNVVDPAALVMKKPAASSSSSQQKS